MDERLGSRPREPGPDHVRGAGVLEKRRARSRSVGLACLPDRERSQWLRFRECDSGSAAAKNLSVTCRFSGSTAFSARPIAASSFKHAAQGGVGRDLESQKTADCVRHPPPPLESAGQFCSRLIEHRMMAELPRAQTGLRSSWLSKPISALLPVIVGAIESGRHQIARTSCAESSVKSAQAACRYLMETLCRPRRRR